jgi:hypothetical protein
VLFDTEIIVTERLFSAFQAGYEGSIPFTRSSLKSIGYDLIFFRIKPKTSIFASKNAPPKPAEIRHSPNWSFSVCAKFVLNLYCVQRLQIGVYCPPL